MFLEDYFNLIQFIITQRIFGRINYPVGIRAQETVLK